MAQSSSDSLIGSNSNNAGGGQYQSLLDADPLPAINESYNNSGDFVANNDLLGNAGMLNSDNFDDLSENKNNDIDTSFNNLSNAEDNINDNNNNNDNDNNDGDNVLGQSWLNNFSSWTMPHLDYSSWFCIGIYLVLMIVVPFLRDGSTSIVLAMNCVIFLTYVYWYAWYSTTSVNDSIKFLSTGFYIIGSVAFIIGIGVYYFLGLPSDVYSYYTTYDSEYVEEYVTILECFAIALIGIACTQQYLIYHLMTRGSNLEIMNPRDVNSSHKVIGGSIGMSIGLICCVNTLSIILFDMQWESRVELYLIRATWAIPLGVCTSYLIGAGIADRELLNYETKTFAILLLPILYNTIAYFQSIVLVALHTQLFLRQPVILASFFMNLVVVSAVGIDVWQRHNILTAKHRIRALRMVPL